MTQTNELERLAASITPGQRVKPLEWRYVELRRWAAHPPLGSAIYIQEYPGMKEPFQLTNGRATGTMFKTLEAAQAAAWEDYEAKVLSAMEPATGVDPELLELVKMEVRELLADAEPDNQNYADPVSSVPATSESAEPVACKTCCDFGWLEHALQACPDCTRPQPLTVEAAAAQVLLDRHDALCANAKYRQANVLRKTEILDFLRALAAKGGQHE